MRKLLPLFIFLASCSGMQESEKRDLRRTNALCERIDRKRGERTYALEVPQPVPKNPYPWEEAWIGNLPRLTPDFFRCKGNSLHLPHVLGADKSDPSLRIPDCEGSTKHGLPLREGKEFIYPQLLELLNFLQKNTGRRVVITSGHCCPQHWRYIHRTQGVKASKHLMGAAVDFYLEGLENKPDIVVNLFKAYYERQPQYAIEGYPLKRSDKAESDAQTPPWYNKEISLKLYLPFEGRNGDNAHTYPYFCLQLRFDRQKGERLNFDWKAAERGYLLR